MLVKTFVMEFSNYKIFEFYGISLKDPKFKNKLFQPFFTEN